MKVQIDKVTVVDTYFYYDRPICFSADLLDQRRLCVLIDDAGLTDTFMVSSPTPKQLADLENNRLPLRDAQLAGPIYQMVEDYKSGKATLELMKNEPTEDMLAEPGVLLSLDQETPLSAQP